MHQTNDTLSIVREIISTMPHPQAVKPITSVTLGSLVRWIISVNVDVANISIIENHFIRRMIRNSTSVKRLDRGSIFIVSISINRNYKPSLREIKSENQATEESLTQERFQTNLKHP